LQRCNDDGVAAHNAAIVATLLLLRRCCYNVAVASTPLLLRRCYYNLAIGTRYGIVVGAALLLQRCCWSALWHCYCNVAVAACYDAADVTLLLQRVAALLLRRCCCSDGITAEILFIFYSKVLGEKMRARKRKRSEIRNMFPSSISWHNTSSFL